MIQLPRAMGAAVQGGTGGSEAVRRCAGLGVRLSGDRDPVQSFIFRSLEISILLEIGKGLMPVEGFAFSC